MADPALSDNEVEKRLLAELPGWRLRQGMICRKYRTSGWKSTLMVVNAVGHLAEAAFHHPDILASYSSVEVRLTTHSAKAITEKDLALARKIEEVIGWQPGRDEGPLAGPPDESRFAYIRYEE